MADTPLTIYLKTQSSEVRKAVEELVPTLNGLALGNGHAPKSPSLLIHEVGKDAEASLDELAALIQNGTYDEVFLTATEPEADLLLKAMRMGVREFLPQPLDRADLARALARARLTTGSPGEAGSGKVVTIAGAKGGIGVTTLAVNLAALCNQISPGKVALVDLREPLGEVPLFLDLEYEYTWAEAVANMQRLDQTFLTGIMSRHESGLWVLPAPGFADDESAELAPEAVNRILDLLRATYPLVIVDAGSALDHAAVSAMECSDQVLLAMVLSLPCLANAKRILENFSALHPEMSKKTTLLVNRYMSKSEISVAEVEKIASRQVDWKVPNDYEVTLSAMNQGRTLMEVAPKSPVIKALDAIAVNLAGGGRVDAQAKGGSLIKRFLARRVTA